ncbi:MAG TPA: hypothetical protein VEC57_07345 [Candidatus Limnocylindrales bacterium]|nr:hypothetical protein [Candidatus Limnocylindrales bacterium]
MTDVRGAPQLEAFGTTNIQNNSFALTGSGSLGGGQLTAFATPYDLVFDCNLNGVLDSADYIDGQGNQTGFFVVADSTAPGPSSVTQYNYTLQGVSYGVNYEAARLFYPSNIGSMSARPLIVIGHGNGFNFAYYNLVGTHLASWGYIVLSHETAVDIGVDAGAQNALEHMMGLLALQNTIANGALSGRIDGSRIAMTGHSRGGESAAIAYMKLVNGFFNQPYFDATDIALVSSMAPTNHHYALPTNTYPGATTPYNAPFHLWMGTADDDVSNFTFHAETHSPEIFGRASGTRSVTSIFGASHEAFSDRTAAPSGYAACSLTTAEQRTIFAGYVLPVMRYYLDTDLAAREFLWRPWEILRPAAAPVRPTDRCGRVYSTLVPIGASVQTIDDFNTNPSLTVTSTGWTVTANVAGLLEAPLKDEIGGCDWALDASATRQRCECSLPTTGTCTNESVCEYLFPVIFNTLLPDDGCRYSAAVGTVACRGPFDTTAYFDCASNPCGPYGTCNCTNVQPGDPMNGSTYAGNGDFEAGAVF